MWGGVRTILASVLVLSHVAAAAQLNQRNFIMGLWFNPKGVDSEFSFFVEGQIQPSGYSVLILSSWQRRQFKKYWTRTIEKEYDLSRIKAVLVDEPYLASFGTALISEPPNWSTPCSGRRKAILGEDKVRLKNVANAIKATSHGIRFWINFSEPEMNWMMGKDCPADLYKYYIDVVSVDAYWRPFFPGVQNYYEWFLEHRVRTDQQIALVPGTFFRKGLDNPEAQASLLQGFFDYAHKLNEFCVPHGGSPPVGNELDSCVVWIVAGWLADDYLDSNGVLWCGEQDPQSAPIRTAWQRQFLGTIRKQEQSAVRIVDAGASCAVPSVPGMNVCAPASGQSYSSPVLITAAGKGATDPVNHLELWIDGHKIENYAGNVVSTAVPLAAGQHAVTLVEVDTAGAHLRSTPVSFTVNSSDARCAPAVCDSSSPPSKDPSAQFEK